MSLHALAQAACVAVETTCCVESLKETPSTDSNATSSAESSATATNIQTSSDDTSRCPTDQDWSRLMTVEERQFITKKIKAAYRRKAPTYEELLDACCAIEEEFVFIVAPSRLDYFKSGVQYEKRIVGKLTTMRRSATEKVAEEAGPIDESARGVKRMKTQH